jgi:DNA-binding transcriptional LysR family regulator
VERAYRISNLWNWLPAFRIVAETEHLPTAARALHVSPSALSRSVKHLEREVGHPLFDREGRGMRLNRAGEQLLAAVRDAMRRVDDGLDSSSGIMATLQITGPAAWLQWIVLPALHDLAPEDHVAVELAETPPGDAERALLRGDVDLIVSELPLAGEQLVVDHLGSISHVLCRQRSAADHELPHAVWTGMPDAWPRHERPEVVLSTPHVALVTDACAAGRAQAILPLAIARAAGLDIRCSVQLPPGQLYLARRRPLAKSRIERVVEQIRAHAASVLGRPGQQLLA